MLLRKNRLGKRHFFLDMLCVCCSAVVLASNGGRNRCASWYWMKVKNEC